MLEQAKSALNHERAQGANLVFSFKEHQEEVQVDQNVATKKCLPLTIPAPKLKSSNSDFLSVIESTKCETDADTNLFVIDRTGNDADVASNENGISEEQPVKKLKRRNAALYASDEC